MMVGSPALDPGGPTYQTTESSTQGESNPTNNCSSSNYSKAVIGWETKNAAPYCLTQGQEFMQTLRGKGEH